ncbi:hypothetical protein DRJ19_00755 [Candidatus Woesearchaeota archaeon]|nr:MAG: hypothetical protein DRJ19_00755 [Candidatus Woesearchaeota archaeon]
MPRPQKYYPKPEYTTWTLNQRTGGEISRLKFVLEGAYGKGCNRLVYVLGTGIEDHPVKNPTKKVKGLVERIIKKNNLPINLRHVCQINGLVHVVVYGSKKDAKKVQESVEKIAREFFCDSRARIGIVEYKGESVGDVYCELYDALRIVREKGGMFHFYDPENDSIDAILRKELEKIAEEKRCKRSTNS